MNDDGNYLFVRLVLLDAADAVAGVGGGFDAFDAFDALDDFETGPRLRRLDFWNIEGST